MNMNEEKFKKMWDKVAHDFGKIGPAYWSYFGSRLVELSSIRSGARILDIGIGRGASLFPAVKKAGKDGYVIGIDFSEVMVSETYNDILAADIHNAEVKKMNAESLNFDDNLFDNVICGFGIGYLLHSESKLNGVIRVLKSGGQAGFSIWAEQKDQEWLTGIVGKYLHTGPQTQNNSRRQEIPRFDNVDDVSKILKNSGFINVRVHEENSDVVYKDKEEWWREMWANAARGVFEQIEGLGSDKLQEFRADIFDELVKFDRGDGLHFNMPVIYAFGQK